MKIIDLRWPWRSLRTSRIGYPSDSWAFCLKPFELNNGNCYILLLPGWTLVPIVFFLLYFVVELEGYLLLTHRRTDARARRVMRPIERPQCLFVTSGVVDISLFFSYFSFVLTTFITFTRRCVVGFLLPRWSGRVHGDWCYQLVYHCYCVRLWLRTLSADARTNYVFQYCMPAFHYYSLIDW